MSKQTVTTLTPTEAAEQRIAALDAEHVRIMDVLNQLESTRADFQPTLDAAQAHAARDGDSHAADLAEQQAAEMSRLITRQRAALTAVVGDMTTAREALKEAQHQAREARLAAIRVEAALLADQIEARAFDWPSGWNQLQALHDEMAAILGRDPLMLAIFAHPAAWRSPAVGLARRWDYLTRSQFSTTLRRLAGDQTVKLFEALPPLPTLRAALGLD